MARAFEPARPIQDLVRDGGSDEAIDEAGLQRLGSLGHGLQFGLFLRELGSRRQDHVREVSIDASVDHDSAPPSAIPSVSWAAARRCARSAWRNASLPLCRDT